MFAVRNSLVEEHREQMRIDEEEEQEIEITLPPVKKGEQSSPQTAEESRRNWKSYLKISKK